MSLNTAQPSWFDDSEVGAPTLNNAIGSLDSLLNAVLVTGFNVKSVSQIEVVSEVATVTCAAHGYSGATGKLIAIAGAPVPALNGRHQPGDVDVNTFTFPAAGVADGVYTGSIDARRAPLGYTQVFTDGVGKSVYGRTTPEASGALLRVNDSHTGSTATDARVLSVESATGVDAYTSGAPTDAQIAGSGYYWSKGPNTATAKGWVICGNEKGFYALFPTSSSLGGQFCYWIDMVNYTPADSARAVLSGSSTALNGGSTANTRSFNLQYMQSILFSSNNPVAQRSRSGIGAAVYLALVGATGSEGGSNGTTDHAHVVIQRPVVFVEQDASTVHPPRGHLPGLSLPMANKPFSNKEIVLDGSDTTYLSLRTLGTNLQGNALISLDNDWT